MIIIGVKMIASETKKANKDKKRIIYIMKAKSIYIIVFFIFSSNIIILCNIMLSSFTKLEYISYINSTNII